MAERSDYLYAQVRKKMLDAVRMDLIGPTAAEEALTELPTNSYITGMLYPADSDITEDENYNDVEFTEGRLDADGNGSESVVNLMKAQRVGLRSHPLLEYLSICQKKPTK